MVFHSKNWNLSLKNARMHKMPTKMRCLSQTHLLATPQATRPKEGYRLQTLISNQEVPSTSQEERSLGSTLEMILRSGRTQPRKIFLSLSCMNICKHPQPQNSRLRLTSNEQQAKSRRSLKSWRDHSSQVITSYWKSKLRVTVSIWVFLEQMMTFTSVGNWCLWSSPTCRYHHFQKNLQKLRLRKYTSANGCTKDF